MRWPWRRRKAAPERNFVAEAQTVKLEMDKVHLRAQRALDRGDTAALTEARDDLDRLYVQMVEIRQDQLAAVGY